MPEIEITQPLSLLVSLLETEDALLSIRNRFEIEIPHSSGSFSYQVDDLWFSCEDWERFISDWKNQETDFETCLADMSDQFSLSIKKEISAGLSLSLRCLEPDLGAGRAELTFSIKLSEDQSASMRREFEGFPQWW